MKHNSSAVSVADLYRGANYGVFAGANGYYVARMAADGQSHYQPTNQGSGWDRQTLAACNERAKRLDLGAE